MLTVEINKFYIGYGNDHFYAFCRYVFTNQSAITFDHNSTSALVIWYQDQLKRACSGLTKNSDYQTLLQL